MGAIRIVRPDAGERQSVSLEADQSVAFSFNAADVSIDRAENDLVFRFDNGAETRIQNFFVTEGKELPSFVLEDGTEVAGADLLQQLNGGMNLETAAGPAAGAGAASGGSGEYADEAGALVAGIDRLDALDTFAWTPADFPADDAGLFAAPTAGGLPGIAADPNPDPGLGGGDLGNPPPGVDEGITTVRVDVANIGTDFFYNSKDGADFSNVWELAGGGYWKSSDTLNPPGNDLDKVALINGKSLSGTFGPDDVVRFRLVFSKDSGQEALVMLLNGKPVPFEGNEFVTIENGVVTILPDPEHVGDYELTLTMPKGMGQVTISEFSIGELWASGNVLDNDTLADSGDKVASFSFDFDGKTYSGNAGDSVSFNDDSGEHFFTMNDDGSYTYEGGGFPPHLDVSYTLAISGETGDLHVRNTAQDARDETLDVHTSLAIVGSGMGDALVANDDGQTLYGEGGNDMIFGGAGDDTIHGGRGSDILTGGGGSDTFVWRTDTSEMFDGDLDKIMDFNMEEGDKLRFEHSFWEGLEQKFPAESLESLLADGLSGSVDGDHLTITLEKQTVEVNFNGEMNVGGKSYEDFSTFANAYAEAGSQDAQQDMMNALLTAMITTG